MFVRVFCLMCVCVVADTCLRLFCCVLCVFVCVVLCCVFVFQMYDVCVFEMCLFVVNCCVVSLLCCCCVGHVFVLVGVLDFCLNYGALLVCFVLLLFVCVYVLCVFDVVFKQKEDVVCRGLIVLFGFAI